MFDRGLHVTEAVASPFTLNVLVKGKHKLKVFPVTAQCMKPVALEKSFSCYWELFWVSGKVEVKVVPSQVSWGHFVRDLDAAQ